MSLVFVVISAKTSDIVEANLYNGLSTFNKHTMLLQILAYALITVGLFFVLSSIVGLFRFPDFYTKMHAAGVADSFGIPLCLLGLSLIQTNLISSIKILVILLLFFLLGPTGSHALIKAAWINKLKPHNKD